MGNINILKILSVKYIYPEFFQLLFKFNYQRKYKVLLLGDSVAERVSKSDTDPRTLAKMIKDMASAGERLLPISHSAYNMKMFNYFFHSLLLVKHPPKSVIIPVNIRSFSPQWYFEPSWQFDNEISLIERTLNDGNLLPRNNYDIEMLKHRIYYPLTDHSIMQIKEIISKKNGDQASISYRKKMIFTYHYTYQLDPRHELLNCISNVINLAKIANINVFFYLTPINFQTAATLIGEDFHKVVHANLKIIEDRFSTQETGSTVQLANYLELLPKEDFFNVDTATEHLNQNGRKKLATRIFDDFRRSIS